MRPGRRCPRKDFLRIAGGAPWYCLRGGLKAGREGSRGRLGNCVHKTQESRPGEGEWKGTLCLQLECAEGHCGMYPSALGRKEHVLHKRPDTVPRVRTEGDMGRGVTEMIGQKANRKRKTKGGCVGGPETRVLT